MLSFFMTLVTIFTRFKERIDNNTAKYKAVKKQAKERLDKRIMNGESTGSKDAKDYIHKQDEKVDKRKRAVTKMLGLITAVVAFFETLPLFFSLITWTMVLIIVMVLVVIIFSFMAYLQGILNLDCLDDIENAEDDATSSSSAPSAGGVLAWTEEELASKGKSLSPYEKNLYRQGMLANKAIQGYGGSKLIQSKGISNSDRVLFVMGISSTENSFSFSNGDKDITKYPAGTKGNTSGYGFMGMNVNRSLSFYAKGIAYKKLVKEYPRPSGLAYDAQFVPYATYMASKHLNSDMTANVTRSSNEALFKKIAKEWGIKANVDEFIGMTRMFLAQAHFHGAVISEYTAYVNWFAAVFAVSSDNDADRHFSNYSIKGKTKTSGYSEGSGGARPLYIGRGTYGMIGSWGGYSKIPNGNSNQELYLNGKKINVALWRYVGEHAKNKSGFNKAWSKVTEFARIAGPNPSGVGVGARVLNFHYGLNSYLEARRVETMLASKMGISASNSSDDSSSKDEKKDKKEDKEDDKKEDKKTSFNATTNNDTMKTNKSTRITMVSEPKVIRELTVQATAYTADCKGCRGVTAAGINVKNKTPNLIAVDKSIIPLGTQVRLIYKGKELGIYYAGDTGGAIKGNIIDILVKDNKTAMNWGRRTVTVQVLSGKGKLSYSNKGIIPLNGAESKSSFDIDEMDDDAKADKEDKEDTKASDSEDKTCKEDSNDSKKSKGDDGDSSAVDVVAGNFKETPGKGQGVGKNGMTAEKILASGKASWLKHMKPYFGTSLQLSKGTAISKSYKDPYGVPFYLQAPSGKEAYGRAIYGHYGKTALTINYAGCGLYAHSYVLSALTGKLINPAETAVWMAAYGGMDSSGAIPTGEMAGMYGQFGLKSKKLITDDMQASTRLNLVYNALKGKKNRLVVVRSTGRPYADGENHFYVVNGVAEKNGKKYFRIYTSAHPEQTVSLQPTDKMAQSWHRQAILVWK